MIQKALILTVTVTTLIACKGTEEAAEPKPAVIAFEGQIEPKLVGAWMPEKGAVKMDLTHDGSAETSGEITTPGGKIMTHNRGKWLAAGDSLLFRYYAADGKTLGDPTKYGYALEGDKLTLTRGSKNLRFVYHRQKAK